MANSSSSPAHIQGGPAREETNPKREGARRAQIISKATSRNGKRKKRITKNNIKSDCKVMRHIEDSLQQACVTWFDLQFPHLSRLLHHSPNGGKRNAREAARFKAMGTRAGFPDLILLYPAHGHHALLIEMKTTRNGSRQTANQKEYQRIVEKHGYKYIVCRTFDEFRHTILSYMKQDSSIKNQ